MNDIKFLNRGNKYIQLNEIGGIVPCAGVLTDLNVLECMCIKL